MSLFKYLELQPIDPQDDGTVSDLDYYEQDEVIDLSHDADGEELVEQLDKMVHDFQMDILDEHDT